MRRIRRRTLGVVCGLTLGWLAAGYAQGWLPWTTPMTASAQSHEVPEAHGGAAPAHEVPGAPGSPGEAAGEHADEGQAGAGQLVPQDRNDFPFLKPVLWTALGLFVAAVVLGIPALKLRGPLPPDPADTHDDHAEDAHAHGDAHDKAGHGQAHGGH